MLNGLDLFSGIGGNTLALAGFVRTIAYCEADAHAQSVLLSRMRDGSIRPAPIWDDITTLSKEQFDVPIDIIIGGFPCQDISVAGNGAGLEGQRSGLFFEIVRLVQELTPTFIFLENVPAIRTRGGERVVKELASLGYDCRWTTLSAAEVGAPHKRERWFLLAAHPERLKLWIKQGRECWTNGQGEALSGINGQEEPMANAQCDGLQRSKHEIARQRETNLARRPSDQSNAMANSTSERCGEAGGVRCEQSSERTPSSSEEMADSESFGRNPWRTESERLQRRLSASSCSSSLDTEWWATEPDVGRMVNELSYRLDKLRIVGSSIIDPKTNQEANPERLEMAFRSERLKRLGNAVVPAQAKEAFKILIGEKK